MGEGGNENEGKSNKSIQNVYVYVISKRIRWK